MEKTLTRKVGEGVAWTTISTFIVKIIGLLTVFLILRELSLYEYGVVELVLSIPALLSLFFLPGLSTTIVADMAVEKGRGDFATVKAISNGFFKLQIFLGIIGFSVLFFGATYIAQYYQSDSIVLIKLVAFSFLISPVRTMITVFLSVDLRYFEQSVISFVEEVVKFVMILVAFFVLNVKAPGVVAATVFCQFFSCLLFLPLYLSISRHFAQGGINHDFSFFKYLGRHGLWGVMLSYLNNFNQRIWAWLVKAFLGTEAVALFAVAQGLLGHTLALVPLNKIIAPLLPQYVEDKRLFFKIADKSIKYQLIAYVSLGIAAAIVFPPILGYIFPNYINAFGLFRIILFTLVATSFDAVLVPMFYAIKAQQNLFFANVYKLFLIVVFVPLLVYPFGIEGVALAFVAVNTFYVLERYRRMKRLLPEFSFEPKDLVTVDEYDRVILRKIVSGLSFGYLKIS